MILVTGATGNVGGELVRTFAAAGQRMRALPRASGPPALPPGVEAVAGDLSDPAQRPGRADLEHIGPLTCGGRRAQRHWRLALRPVRQRTRTVKSRQMPQPGRMARGLRQIPRVQQELHWVSLQEPAQRHLPNGNGTGRASAAGSSTAVMSAGADV
jgi:hypothetical protein